MPLNRDILAKAKAALTKAAGGENLLDKYKKDLAEAQKAKTKTPVSAEATSAVADQPPEGADLIDFYKKKLQEAQKARGAEEPTPEKPFTGKERLQFARMGLDPGRLRFMSSLSALRKGMNLESELLDRALRGQISQFGDQEDLPLSQFA